MSEKIEQAKLSSLIPDSRNANAGTERGTYMLDYSLRNLGAGRSILIDKEGRIIAGNKTAEAAGAIGLDDVIIVETDGTKLVAVKRTDLDLTTDEEARLMAYADNRVSEVGFELDLEELQIDIGEGLDLSGLFTDIEIDEMFPSDEEKPDPGAQVDKAEVLLEKWGVERGQIWTAGRHRIMCGDSTSAEDVGRLMEGEVVRLAVLDPPYGVDYADKNKFLNVAGKGSHIQTDIIGDKLEKGDKAKIQKMWKDSFFQMSENMSPGAVVYCFMPQGGDQMMMMMMMDGAGIEPRHELIWVKNNHVLGRVDYAYKHEPILYAWKKGGHHFYGDFQTSVLEFPKPHKSDLHPTMKPVDLLKRLVQNSSKRGENVLDLFLGSGSVLIACEQTNRTGYGMEIAEKYVSVCLERLSGMGLECTLLEVK